MPRMTRTQLMLNEDEYRFLKARAMESGGSLSSVVRRMVRAQMDGAAQASPHVWDVAGLVTESLFSGKDHDDVLYHAAREDPVR